MTQDDIIRMAREAGLWETRHSVEMALGGVGELERFAALVAAAAIKDAPDYKMGYADGVAAEREACAQFLESTQLGSLPNDTALHYARLLKGFAEGIRARENE